MSNDGDQPVVVLVCLIVAVIALIGFFYVLILFWPYLVFVVTPLVIGSWLVGWVLRLSVLPNVDGLLIFQYKRLAVAFPTLIFLVAVVFFTGFGHVMIVDKMGIKIGIVPEWPKLYHAFNNMRAFEYGDAPFESLRERAKVLVNYDRESIELLALVCVFFGGPAIFWYLSQNDEDAHRNAVEKNFGNRCRATMRAQPSGKRRTKGSLRKTQKLRE